MNQQRLTTWHARLSRAANARLAATAWPPADRRSFVSTFRDDAGHRRPVDGPFLAHVTGITPSSIAGESPDCVLWTQVASSGSERADDRILAATTGHSSALAMHLRESGIEIWTETELACLHALTWLGPAWEARALAAARFLIDELQPDNGTNHPWAIHWFAWLESTQSNTDAGLYAQSLLHNAMTSGGGVPDLFSAIILHDAARWIEDRLAAC